MLLTSLAQPLDHDVMRVAAPFDQEEFAPLFLSLQGRRQVPKVVHRFLVRLDDHVPPAQASFGGRATWFHAHDDDTVSGPRVELPSQFGGQVLPVG